MQPVSLIHDPYAGLTPTQLEQARIRRVRLANIARRAVAGVPLVTVEFPPPKPAPAIQPAAAPPQKSAWFYIVSETRPLTIGDIQRATCSRFPKVTRDDICSSRRTAAVVAPRQIAMYIAKTLTTRSLPEIGRLFGGRDHTTVLHAVRKMAHLVEINPEVAAHVAAIVEMITPKKQPAHA